MILAAITSGCSKMQEMPCPVDDFDGRARRRQVGGHIVEHVDSERSVVGAVQIQRGHRWRLHRRQGLGNRVRIGELLIERRPVGTR